MAVCVLCHKEVEPGDKVTREVEGRFEDFCTHEHYFAYRDGARWTDPLPEAAATEEKAPPEEPEAPKKPLSQLNKGELEALAAEEGVSLVGAKNNDERADIIRTARTMER